MLSIIVPLYNSERYLDNCIKSLLNQTYQDIEVILIDDGSTDSSYEICKKYATIDKRIKLLQKDNAGPASAKNLGLKYAKGNYLTFVDSDDEVALDTYMPNLSFFDNIKDLDIVQFPCHFKYSSPQQYILSPREALIQGINQIIEQWIVDKSINWILCNKIFKRKVLEGFKFPENMVFEDNYLLAEIISKTKKIQLSGFGLYKYYLRSNSITNSPHSIKKENSLKRVNIKILDLLKQQNSPTQLQLEFINKILHNHISLATTFKQIDINNKLDKYIEDISIYSILKSNLSTSVKIKLILTKLIGTKSLLKLYK